MERELRQSFRACSRITSRASSTFYIASRLFDAQTRQDIQALYAFCRVADDIADDPTLRKSLKMHQLQAMREALTNDRLPSIEKRIWPAVRSVVKRHNLPLSELNLVIEGVSGDVDFRPIKTISELDRYSYLVAGVVGILAARVLGVTDKPTLTAAKDLGIAMQYTNIIRDAPSDYVDGRVYIPIQLQKKFQVDRSMLAASVASDELVAALKVMSDRADDFYEKSKFGLMQLPREKRRPVWVAFNLYRGILERIKQKRYNVNAGRIRLNRPAKAKVVLQVYLSDST